MGMRYAAACRPRDAPEFRRRCAVTCRNVDHEYTISLKYERSGAVFASMFMMDDAANKEYVRLFAGGGGVDHMSIVYCA